MRLSPLTSCRRSGGPAGVNFMASTTRRRPLARDGSLSPRWTRARVVLVTTTDPKRRHPDWRWSIVSDRVPLASVIVYGAAPVFSVGGM